MSDCGGGDGGCGDGGGGVEFSWDWGGGDFGFSASSGFGSGFRKQKNSKYPKNEPSRNGICCNVCCKICSICCFCCCCCNSCCQPSMNFCAKCCEYYSCSLSENSYDAEWRRERGISRPVTHQPKVPTESPKERVQTYLLTQHREDTSDHEEHKVPLGDEPLLEKTQVDVHLAETAPVLGPNQENLTLPPYNGTAAQQRQQHLGPPISEPPHYANLPCYNTAYPPPGNNQAPPVPPESYPPPPGAPLYKDQPPDYQQDSDRFPDGLPGMGFDVLKTQSLTPSAPEMDPTDGQESVSTQTEGDLGDVAQPKSEEIGQEDGTKPDGQVFLQRQDEHDPGGSQCEKQVENKVTAGSAGTTYHDMSTLKIERPAGDQVTKSPSEISKDPA